MAVTFGEAGDGVDAWGEKAATTFGTTAAEAEKMASKVGIALEGYGTSQADAAKMSEALVQRSADVAKVLGVDTYRGARQGGDGDARADGRAQRLRRAGGEGRLADRDL